MLASMTKVVAVGPQERLDDTLRALQECALLEVVDASTIAALGVTRLPADRRATVQEEQLRALQVRLDGLLRALPPLDEDAPAARDVDIEEVANDLVHLAPQVEGLVRRLDEMETEEASLSRHLSSLRRLLPLAADVAPLERFDTVALLVDARRAEVLDLLREELGDRVGPSFELLSAYVDDQTLGALLVYPRWAADEVAAVVNRSSAARVHLPQAFERQRFADAIESMQARLDELPALVEDARRELDELASTRAELQRAHEAIGLILARLDVRRRVGATERAFVLAGWTRTRSLPDLRRCLANAGDDILLDIVEPGEDEEPPVLLENPAPARPFEALIRLFGVPKSGSVDGTLPLALFMPAFFGMMLGDVAYGAVLLAGALVARRYLRDSGPTLRALIDVLGLGAAWAIAWGFAYGELLGGVGRSLGLRPLLFDREHAILTTFVLALGVGAAHIVLGVLLGIFAALRRHDAKGLWERLLTLAALAALFALAGVGARQLPAGFMTPAVATVVVSVVALAALHGVSGLLTGPLELLSTVGNVLSYLRLAALGLASVFLARVANELAGLGPVWLGVIIAALLHGLNLVLGAFSPTIQALRLHYVEFFGQFYEAGGREFRPFGQGAPGA
jgi:V/A-type H+-transporting ATPase subunit I